MRFVLAISIILFATTPQAQSQPPSPRPAEGQQAPKSDAAAQPRAAEAPRAEGERPATKVAAEPPAERNQQQPGDAARDLKPAPAFGDGRWGTVADLINAAAAVAVVGLTVALLLVAKAERANNAASLTAMKTNERAYVKLTHEPPGLALGAFTMTRSDRPAPYREVRVSFTIKNFGQTPAEITGVLLQLQITDEGLPDKPNYRPEHWRSVRVFLVRDDTMSMQVMRELDASGVADLFTQRDTLRLYVVGYVDYVDRFGGRHRAGYGRRFDPGVENALAHVDPFTGEPDAARYERRVNLVHLDQPGYNYDRERKPGEGDDW